MTMVVACLMMAVAAQAQGVKISPKMEKGMTKVYQIESTVNAAGKEVKMTAKQTIKVADRTSDGYLLTSVTEGFKSNVGDDDLMGTLMTMGMQLTDGISTTVKTDVDGKVTGIANYEEMKQKAFDAIDVMFNRILEKHPEAAQMLPRDVLTQ